MLGRFVKKLYQGKLVLAKGKLEKLTGQKKTLFNELMLTHDTNPMDDDAMAALLTGKNAKGTGVAASYRQVLEHETVAKAVVERLTRCVDDTHALLTTHPENTFDMDLDIDRLQELASKSGKPSPQDLADRGQLFILQLFRYFLGDTVHKSITAAAAPSAAALMMTSSLASNDFTPDVEEYDDGGAAGSAGGGAGASAASSGPGPAKKRGRKSNAQIAAEQAAYAAVTASARSRTPTGRR